MGLKEVYFYEKYTTYNDFIDLRSINLKEVIILSGITKCLKKRKIQNYWDRACSSAALNKIVFEGLLYLYIAKQYSAFLFQNTSFSIAYIFYNRCRRKWRCWRNLSAHSATSAIIIDLRPQQHAFKQLYWHTDSARCTRPS